MKKEDEQVNFHYELYSTLVTCPHCSKALRAELPNSEANRKPATDLKMACPECRGHIAFPKESIGQIASCPHCSLSLILALPNQNAGTNTQPEKPPVNWPAKKRAGWVVRRTQYGLGGGLVIILAILICLTCYGIPIGLILLCVVESSSRKYYCSECGVDVASNKVRKCPTCFATLGKEQ